VHSCQPFGTASKFGVQDIILYNNGVRVDLEKGAGIEQVMEHWDMLQVNCAAFINSDLPGLPPNHSAVPSKPTRYHATPLWTAGRPWYCEICLLCVLC